MSMRSTSDDHQLTENGEDAIESAKIERLPTFDRLKSSLFNKENVEENFEIDGKRKKMIDVTKLESLERHVFINKLIKHVANDNLRLLQRIRNRVDRYVYTSKMHAFIILSSRSAHHKFIFYTNQLPKNF